MIGLKSRAFYELLAGRWTIMKRLSICLALCSAFMLHGCFDNADNATKGNSSGTKSSVQMQEGRADDNE